MIGIYKIKTGGKNYIGASENIEESFNRHKRNAYFSRSAFYKSLKKDLILNTAQFDIITICKKEELDDLEEYYILKYDSYFNGWNRTLGRKYNVALKNKERRW